MVLLMTKNRHFLNKGLAVNSNVSQDKSKQSTQCKYDNEYDYNQISSVVELYKHL